MARVLDALETSGARLSTYADNIDSDSPAFRLIASVLSEVARAESESTSARVSSRQAADRRAGRWAKPAPKGYVVEGGVLVPGPDADLVRAMVADFLNGASLRSIATGLNERGVPASRGGNWGLSSVRHILSSPTLCGRMPHGKTIVRDGDGAPMIVAAEPLIDEATYFRVQARLQARSRVGTGGRRVTAVGAPAQSDLAGIITCGACQRPMTGLFVPRKTPLLRCSGRTAGRGCDAGSVSYAMVVDYVAARALEHIDSLVEDPEELQRIAERFLRAALTPEERAAERLARVELEAVKADLDRLDDDRADGLLDRDRYMRQVERLNARREVALASIPIGAVDPTPILDVEWMAQALARGGESMRDLLDLLGTRAVVNKGHGPTDLVGDRVKVTFDREG